MASRCPSADNSQAARRLSISEGDFLRRRSARSGDRSEIDVGIVLPVRAW